MVDSSSHKTAYLYYIKTKQRIFADLSESFENANPFY